MSGTLPHPIDNNAPTQDELTEMVDGIGQELRELYAGYQANGHMPERWPNLAAVLQCAGAQLADYGALLAASLAAYAQAHPEIERPEDGPTVLVLTAREHQQFWREASYAQPLQGIPDRAERYAEVLTVQYGRPDLLCTAVALDEQDTGAVLVLQYAPMLGPNAVVRVFLGGVEGDERIAEVLKGHGITAGARRFWPPINPDRTFLSITGSPEVFDAFGRRDMSVPDGQGPR
jgi:hypothetical protein